jgi:hypothetical protein
MNVLSVAAQNHPQATAEFYKDPNEICQHIFDK